ncbi:MAG: hypothetical protein Fur0024_1310 [Patescibacteria group bacterium]
MNVRKKEFYQAEETIKTKREFSLQELQEKLVRLGYTGLARSGRATKSIRFGDIGDMKSYLITITGHYTDGKISFVGISATCESHEPTLPTDPQDVLKKAKKDLEESGIL